MAENAVASSSTSPSPSAALSSSVPSRPSLTLPPRTSMEALFAGEFGASPGPMTLVSSFFAENDPECRSFSQLLAGAMASPAAASHRPPPLLTSAADDSSPGEGGEQDFRFKQNRPSGIMITTQPSVFTVPQGLSPSSLLDSPALFSGGGPSPFGMSHQQALAQVTAQAAQSNYMQVQAQYASSLSGAPAASLSLISSSTSSTDNHQQRPSLTSDSDTMMKNMLEIPHSDIKAQPALLNVDKPADDGYNWRKYGQKHVKGVEFLRSYYKCTHPTCPVKKKVEHSLDGQVTEIIYTSQHNHPLPQANKRPKEAGNQNAISKYQENHEMFSKFKTGKDCDSSQAAPEHLSGSSGSVEVAENGTSVEERDEDEPDSKRRSLDISVSEPASNSRTVVEPKIVVQTTSEVDLLDDGYRWRKYGQKVVKGNPYPRSYYKCTYQGCSVRKHVERAALDPKSVVTTYEGKHNHDVPMGKSNRQLQWSTPKTTKYGG